ncbi:MAG: hypothetical protein HC924_00675 [Synechococcaceae cyanobacterium SM2_3_2]|nr:hypothetical protein [Synechococcaceae cyanobacterium SM2_3_2]
MLAHPFPAARSLTPWIPALMGAMMAIGIPAAHPSLLPRQPEAASRMDVTEISQAWADDQAYTQVIQQVQTMTSDPTAVNLASSWGLSIVDLTWEDTGRDKGSAYGPNISDMTIQVHQQHPFSAERAFHLMPVIRHPNFADITSDIPLDSFYVPVGNQSGDPLESVSLRELLGHLRHYMSEPDSWTGQEGSLLAGRDSHVLVSAQAAFLPIAPGGEATFNPVLFNYQSRPGDPAVLTILATRQGTSITIIDNQRDAVQSGWANGQRLFFNNNGERASLTGTRLSDFQADPQHQPPVREDEPFEVEEDSLNVVLMIQVPLKQRQVPPPMSAELSMAPQASMMMESADMAGRAGVEAAVIGHGEIEGPFTEIDGLPIERDPRFPIRVTVQFYKATTTGQPTAADIEQIHTEISQVYESGDAVGSLVTQGLTQRPTEHTGPRWHPWRWPLR